MMTDFWWIGEVDHRISTALIFFVLLLLLGNKNRREHFMLRASGALAVLTAFSWTMRYAIENCLTDTFAQGIGQSIYLLVMSLLFMGCYALCYRASTAECIYFDLLSVTIYKIAWNTFKCAAVMTGVMGQTSVWSRYSPAGALMSYAVYTLVCFTACGIYQHWAKPIPQDISKSPAIAVYIVFILCQMILEICRCVLTAGLETFLLYYICALMYGILNYAALLVISGLMHYRRDNENMHNFIKNRMQYYEMSREAIQSLQIKCHDLKHQIAGMRSQAGKERLDEYIARLEASVNEYGTIIECGNEAINVVLTEKNVLCSGCGVKFSYMIDGALFDFMSEQEIYSLFGNALDNALEGSGRVSDPQKRMISLKAASRGSMVMLHVENFFEGELNMKGGIPLTTKQGGGHGFGLRSIESIAEKYGGVASVQIDGQVFKLNVLLNPLTAG